MTLNLKALIAVPALLVTAAALTACGTTPTSTSPEATPTVSVKDTTNASVLVPITASFTDPQPGYTVQITGFVPSLPLSDATLARVGALQGGSAALLHVVVSGGDPGWDWAVMSSNFTLDCPGDSISLLSQSFDTDMTAAGYTPYPEEGAMGGMTVTGADGWISFMVRSDPDPTGCSATFTRPVTSLSGGGSWPAFTQTVQLN